MKTYMAKKETVVRNWYVLDAEGKVLGRLATEAARILRGKHKPDFTPHVDTGDHVIIINASKVVLTGNKLNKKLYYHHSGYPGGLKVTKYATLMQAMPEKALQKAIVGMLPHNHLGRAMAGKLKIYRSSEHPHAAQKPQIWPL